MRRDWKLIGAFLVFFPPAMVILAFWSAEANRLRFRIRTAAAPRQPNTKAEAMASALQSPLRDAEIAERAFHNQQGHDAWLSAYSSIRLYAIP